MNLVRLKGKLIGPAIIMLFGITSSYCQKIEISGIMRDIVTGDPIPEVSCEIIDKYSKDIYHVKSLINIQRIYTQRQYLTRQGHLNLSARHPKGYYFKQVMPIFELPNGHSRR